MKSLSLLMFRALAFRKPGACRSLWAGDTIPVRTERNLAAVLFASAVIMVQGGFAIDMKKSFEDCFQTGMNCLVLNRLHRRQILILICAACSISFGLLFPFLAFAQDPATAKSFLFVTANTREHMSDESAWASMDVFEQRNFLAVENYLAARLCSKAQAISAVGMDGTTAENSTIVMGCETGRVLYLGELLGRYAHQKSILIFEPASAASERLLIVSFASEHPENITKLLRQQGIMSATIVAETNQVRVYVWVKDHSQDSALDAFVQSVHGALQQLAGRATLIGSDSRSGAKQIFNTGIRKYERVHHQSFSKLLWSRQLHDLGLK